MDGNTFSFSLDFTLLNNLYYAQSSLLNILWWIHEIFILNIPFQNGNPSAKTW